MGSVPVRLGSGVFVLTAFLWSVTGLVAPAADQPEEARRQWDLLRQLPREPDPELETSMLRRTPFEDLKLEVRPAESESDLGRELRAMGFGGASYVLTAQGGLIQATTSLDLPRHFARLVLIDSVELVPTGPGEVRVEARLILPTIGPGGVESVDALLELVEARGDPLALLGRLAAEIEDLAAGLTRFRFEGNRAEIFAVAVGSATPETLEAALGHAGLEGMELSVEEMGGCLELGARGVVGTRRAEGEDPIDALGSIHPFVWGSERRCAVPPHTGSLRVTAHGQEGLTLRARGARRGDALALLEMVTGVPALGFGRETRRLDADLIGVDPARALDAMAAAEKRIWRFNEALIWSTVESRPAPDTPYEAGLVSLHGACLDLELLFEVFGEISGLRFETPDRIPGCVSVHASGRPWDEVLDGVFAATGMGYEIEGTTVRVRPGPDESSSAAIAESREWWRLEPGDLTISDLHLMALLRPRPVGEWRAFAYGPLDQRYELVPGMPLTDGRIETVDAEGVIARSGDSQVRLTLP